MEYRPCRGEVLDLLEKEQEKLPNVEVQFIFGTHIVGTDITERIRKAFKDADIIALEGVGLPDNIEILNRIAEGTSAIREHLNEAEKHFWEKWEGTTPNTLKERRENKEGNFEVMLYKTIVGIKKPVIPIDVTKEQLFQFNETNQEEIFDQGIFYKKAAQDFYTGSYMFPRMVRELERAMDIIKRNCDFREGVIKKKLIDPHFLNIAFSYDDSTDRLKSKDTIKVVCLMGAMHFNMPNKMRKESRQGEHKVSITPSKFAHNPFAFSYFDEVAIRYLQDEAIFNKAKKSSAINEKLQTLAAKSAIFTEASNFFYDKASVYENTDSNARNLAIRYRIENWLKQIKNEKQINELQILKELSDKVSLAPNKRAELIKLLDFDEITEDDIKWIAKKRRVS